MILIIDFGSQYNQLIARRIREQHVYCQIEPPGISLEAIKTLAPEGIVLSGGPASIYSKGAPRVDKGIFGLGIPVLGKRPDGLPLVGRSAAEQRLNNKQPVSSPGGFKWSK